MQRQQVPPPVNADQTLLRIAIAENEPEMSACLHQSLRGLGHQVVATAQTGQALVEQCRAADPDLVITATRLPDMDGVRAATEVCAHRPVPIILLSAFRDKDDVACVRNDCVMAYLVKPISPAELEVAVALAMRHFEQFQALSKKTADLHQALEDRKVIERAKGVLMKQAGLDEDAAFHRLQKLARSHGQKMAEVARVILSVGDIFEPPTAP